MNITKEAIARNSKITLILYLYIICIVILSNKTY